MTKPVQLRTALDVVEELNVEACIEAKAIGPRIRRLRLKRSMGLVELGKLTGLSASFLSQLETGKVVPTLRNLARIALVLGRDFSYFVNPNEESSFRVSRASKRIHLSIGKKDAPSLVADSLSALIPDRSVIPCIAEFLPSENESGFTPYLFKGLELVYVLEGSLTLLTQQKREVLNTADNAWIDGNTVREYQRNGDQPARAMIITFPHL